MMMMLSLSLCLVASYRRLSQPVIGPANDGESSTNHRMSCDASPSRYRSLHQSIPQPSSRLTLISPLSAPSLA